MPIQPFGVKQNIEQKKNPFRLSIAITPETATSFLSGTALIYSSLGPRFPVWRTLVTIFACPLCAFDKLRGIVESDLHLAALVFPPLPQLLIKRGFEEILLRYILLNLRLLAPPITR